MPNKITYTITTADGKNHQVSEDNINKYGMQSYADAYKDATIRMRDKDGADYDIPLRSYSAARTSGLRPFRLEHTGSKQRTSQAGRHAQQVVDEYDRSVDASQPRTPISQADKNAMAGFANKIAGQVGDIVNQTESGLDNFAARANNPLRVRRENVGIGAEPVRIGENPNVVKVDGGYATESGNVYSKRNAADMEQNQIDDARRRKLNPINTALEDAYAERDRLDDAMRRRKEEIDNEKGGIGEFLRGFAEASRQPGMLNPMEKYQTDEQYRQLEAAWRKNRSTIQTLENKKNGNMDSFWRGFGETAGNGYTFADGLSEINDAIAIMDARKHIDSINRKRDVGQPLTREEEAAESILKNEAINNNVQGQFGREYGPWHTAGSMMANSLDFMKDIALYPGAGGLAKNIAGKVANVGGKYLAKQAGEAAIKAVPKTIARGFLKGTGMLLGAHTAGAVISNTTGINRTAGAAGTNLAGDTYIDENGKLVNDGGMSLIPAIADAERNQIRENGSEMFGTFIPGGVGKFVTKGMEKLGLSKLSNALGNIANSRWYQQYNNLLKAGGFNGIPGEALEEYEGMAFDALTGHAGETWEQLKDPRTHVDIWLGTAAMSALLGAVPVTIQGVHTAQYYRYKHKTNVADNVAAYRFGEDKWTPIREQIDDTPNEKMTDEVMDIINDDTMHPEQKKAALDYIRNLTKMRGFDIAQIANAGNESPVNSSINNSYSEGYNAESDEQLQDINNRYDIQQQQLAQTLGVAPEQVDNVIGDPVEYINTLQQQGRDGEIQAVLDYANAKQAYDGMIQHVQDNIDSQIAQSNDMIDSHVNRDNGSIIRATLRTKDDNGNDKYAYVISGNVVMSPDGTEVDRENSSPSILIVNDEGQMDMVSPDAIMSVDEPLDPEEEKRTAADTIRQNIATSESNRIDGTVNFAQGDNYTLTDNNGQTTSIVVMQNKDGIIDNGDGTVNVSTDGGQTVVPMAKDVIQQMVDNTNRARVMSQQAQQQQAQQPDYDMESELMLTDNNGNPVRATIVSPINEDGQYQVQSDSPINGKKVNLFTADELNSLSYQQPSAGTSATETAEASATQQNAAEEQPAGYSVNNEAVNGITLDDFMKTDSSYVESYYAEHPERMAAEIQEKAKTTADYLNGNMSAHDYLAALGYATGEKSWLDNSATEEEIEQTASNRVAAYMPYLNQPATTENVQPVSTETVLQPQGQLQQSQQSALERVPKDESGQPIYEQTDPDTAWDAIVEQTGGDESMAQRVTDSMVADKEAELKKLEKSKPKAGATINEKIAADKERSNAIEQAKSTLDHWKRIAQVSALRQQAAMAEQSKAAAEAEKQKKAQQEKERAEKEEAERIRREALNGIPDIVDDKPQDARARGYRKVNAEKVDRQQPLPAIQGKKVQVKFDDKNIPTGHVALIDADQLQPSHINGQRNPLHFIDEAQPKERKDEASIVSARNIAANIRPEEITSSVTAYTGAPTVNSRGEVIQGNNRSAALKEMWAAYPEQAQQYKQHLVDHAADYGLSSDDINAMQHPVLVNMMDVTDDEAIKLGQFVAQDTESGGTERIKPKNVIKKMGNNIGSFANILLKSSDDEATFAQLVDSNGPQAIKWMQTKQYITPTQYNSAFDSNGNLTDEAKNDLKGIMYQGIFQNGNTYLEEMFNTLPAKAQKAILATAFRDYNSPSGERLNEEIQASINAYYALSQDEAFVNATNYKDARAAIESWKRQYAIDYVTGESYLPSEKFSNFALLLAAMYKGQTQRFMQNTFNNIYDLVQGTKEANLFEEPDNTPRSLVDAINETLNGFSKELLLDQNLDNNGQQGNNVLAGSNTAGQEREQGSSGNTPAGGRVQNADESTDSTRGAASNSESPTLESNNSKVAEIQAEESKVDVNPTEAQKEAGNYKKGHVRVDGYDITIEQPKGSIRKGIDANGKKWEQKMNNTYGYIRGTQSVDGDHIDIFLSDDPTQGNVYVIDQVNPDGSFDEHKVMYGFNSADEAKDAYLSNYEKGWKGLGTITEVSKDEFKKWINSSHRKTKPFAEYKSVKEIGGQNEEKIDTSSIIDNFGKDITNSTGDNIRIKGYDGAKKIVTVVINDNEQTLPINDVVNNLNNGTWFVKQNRPESPVNKVDIAGLFDDLNKRGEGKLSDHFVVGRPGIDTQSKKKETKSNDTSYGANNKLVSRDKYEELKKRMIKKLGQLNFGMDPELIEIGVEMTAYHLEAGARKFADYAKAMIKDIGDVIRPYLKSLYNAARDYPDVVEAGLNKGMTSADEVSKFDVTNFDKTNIDALTTAETIVKEQEIKRKTEKIIKENEKKSEQTAANTEAIVSKAEAIAGEAERNVKVATDGRKVNDQIKKLDKQIEEVNNQLALLGYYEAEEVEKDYNESYGYLKNAERKAKNDAKSLWQRLVKDLEIPKETVSLVTGKGKKQRAVRSNIAPDGGEIILEIPYDSERKVVIWISLSPTFERGEVKPLLEQGKGGSSNGDNLEVTRIMYRIEDIDGSNTGYNNFVNYNITYDRLLNDIASLINVSEKVNKKRENQPKVTEKKVSSQKIADLFEDLNNKEDDTTRVRNTEAGSGSNRAMGTISDNGNRILGTSGLTETDETKVGTIPTGQSELANGELGTISTERSTGGNETSDNGTSQGQQKLSNRGRSISARNDETKRGSENRGSTESTGKSKAANEESGNREPNRKEADLRSGADGGGKNLSEQTSPKTSSSKAKGNKRNVDKRPLFKHNFSYPESTTDMDNMSPGQRLKSNVDAMGILLSCLKEGRQASPEEQQILSKYRGWGGIEGVERFYTTNSMRNIHGERGNLLNKLADIIDELDPQDKIGILSAIRSSALTSYYTPASIAKSMNEFIELAGFKGGTLLDPSMGSGIFEGTIPKSIQQKTLINGVEFEWITGNIAKLLYPDAHIEINGFQNVLISPNSQDVVISNIPFGNTSISDVNYSRSGVPAKKASLNKIHTYFTVRMIDSTRPGGLTIIMTSNALLDTSGNKIFREFIANQTEILGILRLPSNTFKGAGTSVVTDVLFLRKFKDEADRNNILSDQQYQEQIYNPFLDITSQELVNSTDGNTYKVKYNGYFGKNSDMMIGTPVAGGQYRYNEFGLKSEMTTDEISKSMSDLINKNIIGKRKGKIFDTVIPERVVNEAVKETYVGNGDYIGNGNIVEQNGKYGVLRTSSNKYGDKNSTFVENPTFAKYADRINAMFPLRTAMKKRIADEINNESDEVIKKDMSELKNAYDAYVDKFGRLNDKANNYLIEDIDGYSLRALEKYDTDEKNKPHFTGLSELFTKNTIKRKLNIDSVKGPQEAIALSLSEYGEIRPSFMEDILGENWAEQCGESLFEIPNTNGAYATKDDYLSGDVKTKLQEAEQAAKTDKKFDKNVKALKEVQPKDIPFDDITIKMGARWIPVNIYKQFMFDMFGIRDVYNTKSGIAYSPEADTFTVVIDSKEIGGKAAQWATNRKSVREIFNAALTDETLFVYDVVKDGFNEKTVINNQETEAANDKVKELREAFEDWLPKDSNRVSELTKIYNDTFHRNVLRKFDGSHLNVAGLMGKEPRPHQKDAAWMLICNRGGIVDHIVGAGKTLVMQMAIMEMRRMGIAKKPMIVALKATTAQIAKEFRESFPAARILAPTEKDFSKVNRKKFLANIAQNDWDCVILSHEQYVQLPHTEEIETKVINEQLSQLDVAIEYLYGSDDKSQLTKKQLRGLEKRKQNLESRLESLTNRKVDREFTFENLGVDYLFVDECQAFKSLPYATTYNNVAGLSDPKGSQKAIALLNGVRYLQELHQGDYGTVFLSGTTITNSLVEIYNLFQYLRPSELQRLGMNTFDAWAATFAERSSELEYGVTNQLKEKNRFRSFGNVSELSQMYAEIADVRNDTNLTLPKPKARIHIVAVPETETLHEINQAVIDMVKYQNGSYFGIPNKDKQPWGLLASNISTKAAISPKLIDATLDDKGGKIQYLCENVKKIYDKFNDPKGCQLIFCDTGTPGKDKVYDAYNDIIDRLVNQYGIPRKEIADIHIANTDEKRKALFQKVREGDVRILIGGTKNMGTGVNVQDRIVAMHHVDVPWTPADREQREGRGVRQGNIIAKEFNDNKVDIYFYATEGSLDMYKYQLQDIKGKMFAQFKTGTVGERTFDEGDADENGSLDAAAVVALLSGNPVILEKSKQDKLVERLKRAKRSYESNWQQRYDYYRYLQDKKVSIERLIRGNERDISKLNGNGFVPDKKGVYPSDVTVSSIKNYYTREDEKSFDKPKEAGKYIHQLINDGKKVQLSGFGFKADINNSTTTSLSGLFSKPIISVDLDAPSGIKYSIELSEDDTNAGLSLRTVLQKILKNKEVYTQSLEDINHKLDGSNPGENKFPKQKELEEAIAKKKELDAQYKALAKEDENSTKSVPQVEESNDDVLRQGNGPLNDNELSYENDPVAKLTGNSTRTAEQQRAFAERERERMISRVQDLAKKLHLDNVDIVTDASTLNGRRAKAKGFFNKSTGKITIVIPNQTSVFDAKQTLLHEAVAHYGLRKLFGYHFDTFLKNVFNNADENVRRKIVELSRKHNWDFATATEEYLASLAEDTDFENVNAGWWNKIKEFFLRMLHSIGFDNFSNVTLSDNELRYILWRSYENLAEPGRYRSILGIAEDVTMQSRLGVGNFANPESRSDVAAEPIDEVNRRFNEQLAGLTEENKDSVTLFLGRPSPILRAAGVEDKPIKLYGSKIVKKMKKHGFKLDELRNLPEAVAYPIAVFNNTDRPGNRSVLTELKTENGNILVTLDLGKGIDADFDIVSSVFGKSGNSVVHWLNKGFATYIDKEKALNYLHLSAPIAEASNGQELSSATNIVKNFDNPSVEDVNLDNVNDDGVFFRDFAPEIHERVLARNRYELRLKRGMYQSQEAIQDSMLSLQEAMNAILKAEGKKKTYVEDIDGFENAYIGENRLSSVNKAEADAFANLLFKPLLNEVAKLAPNKDAREELTDYMMAKHGLERNRVMRQREKEKLISSSEIGKNEPIEPKPDEEDYDLKMDAYTKAYEDWENQVELELGDKLDETEKRDFAGLTALTESGKVEEAEDEAKNIVENYESGHDTSELWKRVNDVSNAILSKLYDTGMMSKKTYDDVKSMYDYYIPLRGFDEKTSKEAYAYLTSKDSAFTAPIKTAKGRKSKADDPFAYLQNMAESAIMQGNRNMLVKQRFLNFVLNHPSDLASVSDIWLQYDKTLDEWKPVFPDNINSDDTAEEVEKKMQDFEDKMKDLAEKEPDLYKHGKETINIPYRVVDNNDLHQHQIVVKRNGRDYVITINGNPRVAQALNGQTNPDNDISGAIGAIMKAAEGLNRKLSSLYTTRNPDFMVSNFIRDMLYSNSMVWIKENPIYALRYNRNFMKFNPAYMKILFAKYRKNTLDMNNHTEYMFKQFMMNGGETGYSNIRDVEKRKNDIRKELKKANGRMPIRKAWDLLSERFDELNRSVENCARFTAFVTSREMGRTIDRSIYDSKEISVNFNKKGSGSKFMGTTGQTKIGNVSAFTSGLGRTSFVFWNAAVQGTANFGKQIKRHPAKALTGLATMFILGALVAYLGYEDDDDDDKNRYWNLPEYVRRSNILFRAGDQWISIPLPVEYKALYGLGELMVSTMSGKEHLTDEELAYAIAGQVSQIMPLDLLEGGGGLKTFIPSSIKPLAEAYGYNKSWTGLPIYKDTHYNKEWPEWTKAYKSSNKYLVNLAEALNEYSGGDKYTKGKVDVNPAKLEYVLTGYFGGIANTIDRLSKMGETMIGQREYDPNSFLILNRIIKNGDERTEYKAINNEYFRLKDEHDKFKKRLRNYEKDTENGIFDYAEKINMMYNSPEYKRYEIFEAYQPTLDEIYDIQKNSTDDNEIKSLEQESNEIKKEMISEMNKTRDRK